MLGCAFELELPTGLTYWLLDYGDVRECLQVSHVTVGEMAVTNLHSTSEQSSDLSNRERACR